MSLATVLSIVFLCFVISGYIIYLVWVDAPKEVAPEILEYRNRVLKFMSETSGDAYRELAATFETPIPMVLFCPGCGAQHIDEPDEDAGTYSDGRETKWANPPHRSHLCQYCRCVWRPADVPTIGVQSIKTRGQKDWPFPYKRIVT
jgi:hypothetical protein